MYKIAIVEDEEKQVSVIKECLRKYEKEKMVDFEIVFFSDGDEIVENYDCSFDLILMDIMMRFMDGMTAAEEIRKKDDQVEIIFITNMVNYAIKGYQVGALDYILKPISYFPLEKSLSRAISKIAKNDNSEYIYLGNGSSTQKVSLNEICFIESYAHYLTFHTMKEDYTVYMRMKDIEETLKGKHFYRVSKSAIVNLKHIDGIDDGVCKIGQHSISISRANKKDFMEKFTNYMCNR